MAYSIGLKPFSLKGEDDEPITRNNKIKWEYNMKAFTGATPSWQQFLSGGTHDSWLPLDEDPGRGVVVHPVHVNDPTDRRAVDYAMAAAANRTNQMRRTLLLSSLAGPHILQKASLIRSCESRPQFTGFLSRSILLMICRQRKKTFSPEMKSTSQLLRSLLTSMRGCSSKLST